MSKQRKLAYLALLVSSIIWGVSPPIIKYTLQFISPTTFLFYRFLIASLIIIIPLALKLKKPRLSLNDLWLYLFLGFLATPLNLFLLFAGINKTTSIDASVISIISPILVILGGALWLKEKINRTEKIGIAITVLGTTLTIIQPLLENTASVGKNIYGNFLVFLGAVAWVVFTLLAKKKHRQKIDPFLLTAISFLVGLLTLTPFFIRETLTLSPLPFNPGALWGILFTAVFCSVIAYFTYIYGLTKIEASEATIFTYLQPLFSIPLAIIFLGEKTSPAFWLGAFFITAGVFICEFRRKA